MGKLKVVEDIRSIEINQSGKGRFGISLEADGDEVRGNIQPVIFKIKCNLKHCIEVTPVYGFLMETIGNGLIWVDVKYPEERQKIGHLKLQICWIEIDKTSIWLSEQFTKDQYPDIYKKCLATAKEDSLIINFHKEPIPKEKEEKKAYNPVSQKIQEFRFQSKVNEDQKERLTNIYKKNSQQKEELSAKKEELNAKKEELNAKKEVETGEDRMGKEKPGWSVNQLLCWLLYVLMFGMTVGIKLSRLERELVPTGQPPLGQSFD